MINGYGFICISTWEGHSVLSVRSYIDGQWAVTTRCCRQQRGADHSGESYLCGLHFLGGSTRGPVTEQVSTNLWKNFKVTSQSSCGVSASLSAAREVSNAPILHQRLLSVFYPQHLAVCKVEAQRAFELHLFCKIALPLLSPLYFHMNSRINL